MTLSDRIGIYRQSRANVYNGGMDILREYEKTTEVAERLDIDTSQIRRYCEQERFDPPAVKIGNLWLIPRGAMPVVKDFGRPPTWQEA